MRRPFAAVAVLSTAAAVLALAGCGSSTSPGSTNFKSLTAGQQAAFETDAVTEVEANVGSFANFDPYGGFGFERVVPRRGSALLQIVGGTHQGPRFQTNGCQPTISGDQTDADGDGVPANATATFNCSNSPAAGDTIKETGTISVTDPTPTIADLEYTSGVNLTITETTTSSGDLSLGLTGQGSLTQSPGTLTESGNATLNVAVTNAPSNGNGTVKFSTNNNATYTYTGGSLTSFGALPDGTFNLTGNWSYDVNSSALKANLSFSISTPGGLSIKAACTSNSGRIDSGEIDIKFSDGTLVKAQYSGCPATPSYTIS